MSVKNMFSSPFQAYLKAYNSKLAWANSSCSDCIAYLHAYTVCNSIDIIGRIHHVRKYYSNDIVLYFNRCGGRKKPKMHFELKMQKPSGAEHVFYS